MSSIPMSSNQTLFLRYYGDIYEHSEWVALAVWPRVESGDIETLDELFNAMMETVERASVPEQLRLIRAHPQLADSAAIAADITPASASEQSSAGLDQCTPAEFNRFSELNRAYSAKFDFPFIIAVRGLTREHILKAFSKRLTDTREQEFKTALWEVHKIANIRLGRLRSATQEPTSF